MKHKIIISASGTAGHLFPAQALAQELQATCDTIFIAGELTNNPFFCKKHFSFYEVSTAHIKHKSLWQICKAFITIYKGFRQTLQLLDQEKPECIIAFGSFLTLPVVMAAYWKKIPYILHEQNLKIGITNRLFAAQAACIATLFPLTIQYPTTHVAYRFFSMSTLVPHYNLADNYTLLILGGSKGAQRLNQWILSIAHELVGLSIIHLTGHPQATQQAKAVYTAFNISHHVQDFEPNMQAVWPQVDAAITRAGAATILELITSETPAITIPYPYATLKHQHHNANYFVQHVGGGIMVEESQLQQADVIKQLQAHTQTFKNNIYAYKQQRQLPSCGSVVLDCIKSKASHSHS